MEKKYQVFISSTYKDLIEARSKVRDAILSMMHFPVGMEMFNAADEEQWEIIQETIDSSDYYVLILGQRYGSVIESGSDAGISYTEKEFRYAREKKIPVLVFIIDDDVAIKPEFIEKDPESIKKLADFKTEAKKGRTVQWWTNIDELAREVSESLHQQMDRKKRPGWIRGDAFDIEASHAEILSLNKKIRELEQENAELKSQIVKRVPELMAAVVLDQQDDEEVDGKGLKTHGKLLIDSSDNAIKIQLYHNDGECYKNKYEPLDLSCVESHLKKYVKEKDLQAYNAALPSEEEINDYAHKMSVYKTITNGGVALKLRVLNKGTAKATDIRISIVFPKDIFVYDIDDIEKMKEPKAPKLPPNPIEKAEERFMSDLNPVYGLLKNSMDGMQPFCSARSLPIIDPAIFNNSNSSVFESISIRDNSIFAECNQLPHKDDTEFDGIYIVPARKGKFKVSVSLMCSEYIEPKVHDIEFEIV